MRRSGHRIVPERVDVIGELDEVAAQCAHGGGKLVGVEGARLETRGGGPRLRPGKYLQPAHTEQLPADPGGLRCGEEGDDAISLVPPLAVFTPTGRVDLAAGPGRYALLTLRAEEGRLYLQRNDLLLELFALPSDQRLHTEPSVERYALTAPATP
jgi:hypothetical protein